MRAVRNTPEGIAVVEVESPQGEGIRIHPRSISICQTDVNMLRFGARDLTIGHEFAGETDDGTPVAIEPIDPCGTCEFCAIGDYHWCERTYSMIAGIGYDGGMADEIVVPARSLVPLPAGLNVADAAICEPLAVNLHSLILGRLAGGMRVAVSGAGMTGFGLMGGIGAKWRGCPVDVATEEDHLLAASERLGLGTSTSGTYDMVIEGDGSEDSITRAAELARPGGTVLMVAGYYEPKTLNVLPFVVKELTMVWGTLYGRHAAGRSFDSAAALLAMNPDVATTMITHRFPLDAAAEAFDTVTGPTPSIKVVLEP